MNEFTSAEFQDAMTKALDNVRESFDRMRKFVAATKSARTPEQIDAGSRWHYERAVERERAKGLKFVKQCALDARKELGL